MGMTTTTLILMTALAPTTGHRDLIEFAAHMPSNEVFVMVNARSFEPVAGELRVAILQEEFQSNPRVHVVLDVEDDSPQNPEDHPDFWNWWKTKINLRFPDVAKWDFVVASETYGRDLASSLGATFMPFDLERELNPTRSTRSRLDHETHWATLLPGFRRAMAYRAVMFGQESVGKTSISRALHERFFSTRFFEFARPYLEEVVPYVDEQVMDHIHRGQTALQELQLKKAEAPLLLLDTDLFNTVGYWGIMRKPAPESLVTDALRLRADVYYLLPDDFPLVEDPIRFGGRERESDLAHWQAVCSRYGLPTVEVPGGSLESKVDFIEADLRERLQARWAPLRDFQRT